MNLATYPIISILLTLGIMASTIDSFQLVDKGDLKIIERDSTEPGAHTNKLGNLKMQESSTDGLISFMKKQEDSQANGLIRIPKRQEDSQKEGLIRLLKRHEASPTEGVIGILKRDSSKEGLIRILKRQENSQADGLIRILKRDSPKEGLIRILKRQEDSQADGLIRILKRDSPTEGLIRMLKRKEDLLNEGLIRMLKREEESPKEGLIRILKRQEDSDGLIRILERQDASNPGLMTVLSEMAKTLPSKPRQEEPSFELSNQTIQNLKRQDSNEIHDEAGPGTSTTDRIIRILLSRAGSDPRNIDEDQIAYDVNANDN